MFFIHRSFDKSTEQIRAHVVERLRRALPGHSLRVRPDDPFRLKLSHPEAGELVLNLGNLVHEIHEAPSPAAEQMIAAYVAMAKQALNPPEIELSAVYPALRHHEFLEYADVSTNDPLIGEGPGDLISVVLADLGDGLATVTEDAADRAGLAPEEILHAAEQNFVELLPREVYTSDQVDGVVSIGLDSYPWLGTGLLFVPSIILQVMLFRGWSRVHVCAPTRETVDLVDARRSDALDVMERWMVRRLAEPRSQSEFVLSMSAGDEYLTKSHKMSGERLLGLN